MTRLRTLLFALATSALMFGSAFAAGVAFDDSAFDPFDEDEGYVDIVRDDDVLTVIFDESSGALAATMEGDALPLDDDFDEDRLGSADALALYGGLPVTVTPNAVLIEVEGHGATIHDAVLDRLSALGVTASEFAEGGPVRSYELSYGDAAWRLAITPTADGATIYLQID